MKKILVSILLIISPFTSNAEIQLFPNFDDPLAEKNRKFIEQVHEHFSFDKSVIEIFMNQTKGPILNSFVLESACIKTLGGNFVFTSDLFESKKYEEQLRKFFISTDGPRKAKIFSGIILGTLDGAERADLLSVPGNSKLVNKIVNQHFISMLLSTNQAAFVRAAEFFFNVHCPR